MLQGGNVFKRENDKNKRICTDIPYILLMQCFS